MLRNTCSVYSGTTCPLDLGHCPARDMEKQILRYLFTALRLEGVGFSVIFLIWSDRFWPLRHLIRVRGDMSIKQTDLKTMNDRGGFTAATSWTDPIFFYHISFFIPYFYPIFLLSYILYPIFCYPIFCYPIFFIRYFVIPYFLSHFFILYLFIPYLLSYIFLSQIFRGDSISLHLPLSVSGWVSETVSQWVIDSFRLGDSYCISELCKLVLPNILYPIFLSHIFCYPIFYPIFSYPIFLSLILLAHIFIPFCYPNF